MSQLQDLLARMRLDNAQFSRGLRQAKTETQSFGQQLVGVARTFAAPLAAAFSFSAIAAGARRGAQEIDELAKSARAVDGSIGGVRAAELAMSEAGVSASVFRQEMQNLNRTVSEGRAEGAMRALGIETREFIRLDADQKLALIADRVRELGLDAGSTNAILSQFGIRNRDIALLMMQGGDAIRAARDDIDAYGLALSQVDSARIEEANDRIGRLSVVGQYLRQELALSVTPALGQFAQALTESMREGGALRSVIDGLVSLVPRLGTYIATAAAGAGVYALAMKGIAAAKWLVVSASNGLRAALMRLGIPALVMVAGELVFQFGRLVNATGGWAEALDLLRSVAEGVWNGIKTSAAAIVPALQAIWKDIQAGFFSLMEAMTRRWTDFLLTLSAGVSNIPGADEIAGRIVSAASRSDAAMAGFTRSARAAAAEADSLRSVAAQMAQEGFGGATDALSKLREVMARADEDGAEYGGTIREIYNTLNDIGDGGGGGAAGRAERGIREIVPALEQVSAAAGQVEQSFESAFVNFVSGAQSAREAIANLLQDLARLAAQDAFRSLFGAGGGGAGLFAGFFDSGGSIPRGRFGVVAEKRDEFVNGVLVRGPANVTGGAETARLLQQRGGSEQVIIRLVAPEGFTAEQVGQVRGVALQVVQAGLGEYDRRALPGSIQRVQNDPRRR